MVDTTRFSNSQQIHTGTGPQIGRDHIGDNHFELMDPGTKALVEKMAKTAPEFARALERATREGIMSPAAVAALERAFNMDVAMILRKVGDHINWDVADMLYRASMGINQDVANSFFRVESELKGTVDELASSIVSLRGMVSELKSTQGNMNQGYQALAEATPVVASTPSWGLRSTLWFKFKVFCFGSGLGLLGAILLMKHHLGGWAVTAVVAILGIPAVSLFNWYMAKS
jgi:hypothetical protein